MFLLLLDNGCFTSESQVFFHANTLIQFFPVLSAADWRYAAEQFVKKLPDKVIVHREFSPSHVDPASPAH